VGAAVVDTVVKWRRSVAAVAVAAKTINIFYKHALLNFPSAMRCGIWLCKPLIN
jgi:hypothetical protein